jgi:hypothetical protein
VRILHVPGGGQCWVQNEGYRCFAFLVNSSTQGLRGTHEPLRTGSGTGGGGLKASADKAMHAFKLCLPKCPSWTKKEHNLPCEIQRTLELAAFSVSWGFHYLWSMQSKNSKWKTLEISFQLHIIWVCVSQLSLAVINAWDNQIIKRKGLFCLTVLEVSVHSWLILLLLGLWWISTSWWDHTVEQAVHLMEDLGAMGSTRSILKSPSRVWSNHLKVPLDSTS